MPKRVLIQVRKEQVTVLPELQRRLISSRIAKLTKDWKPNLVGIIQLAELQHNGATILHPMDGQHRVFASPAEFEFDAVVTYGLSKKEVVDGFMSINQDSSRVAALDQYELGQVNREPVAIATKNALDASDIVASSNTRGNEVAAVAALMAVVKEGKRRRGTYNEGTASLVEALSYIEEAWPTVGPQRYHQDIIKSIGYITARWNGHVNEARLLEKLEAYTPEQWMLMAQETMQSTGGSGGKPSVLQGLIVKAYNSRLGKAKKLV